ncbi:MAG: hypothetical protein Q9227_001886 [Pyrenula ochraceoflavens]
MARLEIDGTRFRDAHGREITLRGINVAGDAKYPRFPNVPSHERQDFFDGDNVSFVGRPFNEEEAHLHFARLKRWGYNTIRYVFTWEAIEHKGPRQYDEAWIEHTIKILRLAKEYGFYVFMDPHQDVWSRFSGGSGAPMWTLYAAGLNPETFAVTQAAWVHNTHPNPAEFPKMIWATNYWRMTCQTIFTLFFGGKDFAPNAIIDGQNIQEYLQGHYIGACKHLAQRIHEAGDLEGDCVIGWESMNEPNRGLISFQDLSVIPPEQKLQKGPSPTAWQALLTGAGRACEVDVWDVGSFGPYKSGRELIDPEGVSAWLPADYEDSKYGWKRDPGWKLGQCLWAQNGVWDPSEDKLLKKDFFSRNPRTGKKMDYESFTNTYFMEHFRSYRDAIRSVHSEAFILCEAPVLEIPPDIKGTEDDEKRLVFATHYYDGLTLLTKHWNRYYNIDVFGVLRGKYLAPAFALKIGENAIRACLKDQLEAIRQEGLRYMGTHPCIFTEIGIPFDMDDKYAYKTGDYASQAAAMDANHFALEGCGAAGYTLWVYVASNNHEWGDNWNGEDLSVASVDDKDLSLASQSFGISPNESTISLSPASPSFSHSRSETNSPVTPSNVKDTLKTPSIMTQKSSTSAEIGANPGLRAADAFVRPSPWATNGNVMKYGFDMKNCTFTLSLEADKPTVEGYPTTVFLPEYHFPRTKTRVEVSGGKWTIDLQNIDGGSLQTFQWWHGQGTQELTIRGVKRKQGAPVEAEEDEGYYEQCRQGGCAIM